MNKPFGFIKNQIDVKTALLKKTRKQAENGRSLHVNWQREEFEREVDERLAQEDGWELKKERKCQVEGAFGILKEDRQFTRFHYRGLEKVTKEFDWQCVGFNLKKYHLSSHRKKKESPESPAFSGWILGEI